MNKILGVLKYFAYGAIIPIVLVFGVLFDYLKAIIAGYEKMHLAPDIEMQKARMEASQSWNKAKQFYSSDIVKKYKDGEI